MSFEGDLSVTPFAQVLRTLAGGAPPGILTLESGDTVRRLYHEGGSVHLLSRPRDENEPFGEVLVFMRAAERRQVRQAMESREAQLGKPLWQILEAQGVVTRAALKKALADFQRERLFDLFQWIAGKFRFEEGAKPDPDLPIEEIPGFRADLLAEEGESRLRDWMASLADLPGPDDILRLDLGTSDSTVIPNVPESITRLLDGTLHLEEILSRSHFPRLRTVEILRSLSRGRFLRSLGAEELLNAADRFAADPFDREIKFLTAYVQKVPQDEKILQRLAEACEKAGKVADACRWWTRLGNELAERGMAGAAVEVARRAVRLDPQDLAARRALFFHLFPAGMESDAIEEGTSLASALLAHGRLEEAGEVAAAFEGVQARGAEGVRCQRVVGQVRHARGDEAEALAAYGRAEALLAESPDPATLFDLYQDLALWESVPDGVVPRLEELGKELPEIELFPVEPPGKGPAAKAASGPGRSPGAGPGAARRFLWTPRRKRRLALGIGTFLVLAGAGAFVTWQESVCKRLLEEGESTRGEAARLEADARKSGAYADFNASAQKYRLAAAQFEEAGGTISLSRSKGSEESAIAAAKANALAAEATKIQKAEAEKRDAPFKEVSALLAAGKLDQAGALLAALRADAPTGESWYLERIATLEKEIEKVRVLAAKGELAREIEAAEKDLAGARPEESIRRLDAAAEKLAPHADLARSAAALRERALGQLTRGTVGAAAAAAKEALSLFDRKDLRGASGRIADVKKLLDGFPPDLATPEISAEIARILESLASRERELARLEEEAARALTEAEAMVEAGRLADSRAAHRRLLDTPELSFTRAAAGVRLAVRVSSSPDGARVRAGAAELGVTPCTLRLAPDALPFKVSVEKRGYAAGELQIATGGPVELSVALARVEAWSAEVGGAVEATPRIADGRVFVGARDGVLYAFDARPDAPRRLLFRHSDNPLSEIAHTPLVLSGVRRVVYGTVNTGTLYSVSYEREGEAPAWRRSFEGWFFRDPVAGAAGSSQRIFVPNQDRHLYSIDAATGDVIWRVPAGELVGSLVLSGDALIAVTADGAVLSIDPGTGRTNWRSALGSRASEGAAVAGGRVHVAVFDRKIEVFDLATGNRLEALPLPGEGRARPISAAGGIHAIAIGGVWVAFDLSGRELWRVGTGLADPRSPAALGSKGYAVDKAGSVVALDLATGRIDWTFDARAAIDAPPAAADGLLVIATSRQTEESGPIRRIHAFEIEE